MVILPHVLAGALSATPIQHPFLAVTAGILSHLALDRIPHSDYSLNQRRLLATDALVALAVTAALPSHQKWGSLGGILPDILHIMEAKAKLNVTTKYHHNNHTTVVPPIRVGIAIQVITVAAAATLLLRHKRSPS